MRSQFKTLVLALALATVGAAGASSAQAAEFHCSVEPCTWTAREDGTGKTAHQVFIISNAGGTESVSFTFNKASGHGQSATKTASTITLLTSYFEGTVNGSPGLSIVMNGCDQQISSAGTMSITSCDVGKSIEIKLPTGCVFTIGQQGPLSGVSMHTLGTTPNREITVSMNVPGIAVTADGTDATCLIKVAQTLTMSITTGNAILTGETPGGVMADAWFA